jgi:hypothetical protein
MLKRSILAIFLLLFTASCGVNATPPSSALSPTPVTQRVSMTAAPTHPQSDQTTLSSETPLAAVPTEELILPTLTTSQPDLPPPIPVIALATDPFDSRTVLALMSDMELYRTQDRGTNWQQLPLPVRNINMDHSEAGEKLETDPYDLRFSPYTFGYVFLRAGGVIFASQDSGEAWTELIDEVKTWFVDDEGIRLYAWRVGDEPGLYSSSDSGQHWQLIYPTTPARQSKGELFTTEEVSSMVIGYISDAELFISTANTIFRSPDGGKTWREQPLGDLTTPIERIHLFKARSYGTDLFALVQTGEGPYLARFDLGWVSPDQDHWEILTEVGPNGLEALIEPDRSGFPSVYTLVVDPYNSENLYLGTNRGILFSTDGGISWKRYDLFQGEHILCLAILQCFERDLYAGTESGVKVAQIPEPITPQIESPIYQDRVNLEPVAQAGGSLGPYVASNELVYAAKGPYLVVIDFGDSSGSPRVIWQSPTLTSEILVLAIDENNLFSITRDGQLHYYDLTNSRQPVLNASVPISPESRYLSVQGNQAALIESRCQGSQCYSRLSILDLSSRLDARITGIFDLPGSYRGMYMTGSLLFIAYENGLLAFDVSSNSAPHQLVEYRQNTIRSAQFAGSFAYLGLGSSLEVLDLSDVLDRTEPYEITQVSLLQADHEQGADFYLSTFTVSGNVLYGIEGYGEFGYCWSSMFIIDVSDPTIPALKTGMDDLPILTCSGQPQAVGKWLYVPDWDGLHRLDLSDALHPQSAGFLSTLPKSFHILPYQDEYLYLTTLRADTSLYLIDLHDPAAPSIHGPLIPGWTYESIISGDYMITSNSFEGLQMVEVKNPFQPRMVASIPPELVGNAVSVTAVGNIAYVNEGDKVVVIDMRDPLQLAILGQYGPTSSLEPQVWMSLPAVSGFYAYFVETQEVDRQELTRLSVVDVLDPANPIKLNEVSIPGKGQTSSQPIIVEGALYIPVVKGIIVADIAKPLNPQVISQLDLPGGVFDVAYSKPYLFVAGGQAGLWVIDVTHPFQPMIVGRYDTPGTCSQVAVQGDVIYINDGFAGILLFRVQQ